MQKQENINTTPFAIVVKYITAESFLDTSETKKYIDIDKVYIKYIDKQNPTPNKVWESQIMFNQSLNSDKKLTNFFKFHKYDMQEIIKNNAAKVIFTSKIKHSKIKSIIYSLELTSENKWIIVDIDYKTQ
jgi:hypothetical protein